ncbi:glutamate carrier [Listeria marthii FSL S4-120]|uniref:Glutamate carrier n=1 Tax=Listeria marthii FSL S4-120 TaxID=702457 RepID=A0ABN0BV68_9LIST|nr:glutamate carrier [Listeria marthii FSL S4-120]
MIGIYRQSLISHQQILLGGFLVKFFFAKVVGCDTLKKVSFNEGKV